MCVTGFTQNIQTELKNVCGFGWKVIDRNKKGGGLFASVCKSRYHEYKWNTAKHGSNSYDYDRGFHIPLTKTELIDDMYDIEQCMYPDVECVPVLVYVEYKEGHTLGEDYGPCIVANRMRIIDMYVMKSGKLVKLKKGLGRNWLKDVLKDKQNVKVSKKKN